MRIDRNFVGWGIFLIILGGIPLLHQQGLIQTDALRAGPSLWPLIIVGIGLGLLLRETAIDWAGGLLVAATAGVIGGSLLATGGGFTTGICSGDAAGPPLRVADGTMTGGGAISVDLPCGDLDIDTAPGDGWTVQAASGDARQPDVAVEGDTIRIDAEGGRGFVFGPVTGRAAWTVTVPRDPTIGLWASLNAGEAVIDLEGAHLDELRIEMNAGSARVAAGGLADLGSLRIELNAGSLQLALPARSFGGRLEANAGSLDVCVPDGTGLRITMDGNITASHNFGERGLGQSGDVWSRSGTNGATIDLVIDANAASITLDPEDGC